MKIKFPQALTQNFSDDGLSDYSDQINLESRKEIKGFHEERDTYECVGNNPVFFIDMTGLFGENHA